MAPNPPFAGRTIHKPGRAESGKKNDQRQIFAPNYMYPSNQRIGSVVGLYKLPSITGISARAKGVMSGMEAPPQDTCKLLLVRRMFKTFFSFSASRHDVLKQLCWSVRRSDFANSLLKSSKLMYCDNITVAGFPFWAGNPE